jgi:hypothetical protein
VRSSGRIFSVWAQIQTRHFNYYICDCSIHCASHKRLVYQTCVDTLHIFGLLVKNIALNAAVSHRKQYSNDMCNHECHRYAYVCVCMYV